MGFQRRHGIIFFMVAILLLLFFILFPNQLTNKHSLSVRVDNLAEIQLPDPLFTSKISIEEALKKRRTIRSYRTLSLTLQEIAQILWAAQGVTSTNGLRTAPSAGALYPLEVFLIAGNVEKLLPGVYHYIPEKHSLQKLKEGDFRIQLTKAAIGQDAVKLGAANIVITAVPSRTTKKYGDIGKSFVLIEAGHVAQNIYLQSVSLHLGTVSIGAFDNKQVKNILNLSIEEPLYIMPIGKI